MYTDERLTCTDCGAEFTFSAGEQQFFATKGFQNKPNRCPECRTARKNSRQGGGSSAGGFGGGGRGGFGGGAREMYSVTCSGCGQPAEVPFQPRGDKPVYCRDCFQQQRSYR
ncbi:MAG TPA: zinc-ribbon domain containing protein [Candidatus Limnocylindria bacterium]|nr:zinc-ribbon domain containing protein [Candidatus Limnocylindria bacterium]